MFPLDKDLHGCRQTGSSGSTDSLARKDRDEAQSAFIHDPIRTGSTTILRNGLRPTAFEIFSTYFSSQRFLL